MGLSLDREFDIATPIANPDGRVSELSEGVHWGSDMRFSECLDTASMSVLQQTREVKDEAIRNHEESAYHY